MKTHIRLDRLRARDLELVRGWRNDPRVSMHMEFRDPITPEMQRRWFASINNERNYYFLISLDSVASGVINLKNVDAAQRTAEGGIFYSPEAQPSAVQVFAVSLAALDFAFGPLGVERMQVHILQGNRKAARQSEGLGYQLQPGQEQVQNQRYLLSRERYQTVSVALKKLVAQHCETIVNPVGDPPEPL